MKILVINCGSSSLKYQLFDMDQEECLARGGVERVGSPDAFMTHRRVGNDKVKRDVDAPDHERGLKYVFDALVDPEIGVINSLSDISAIGHRVVHGGEKFAGMAFHPSCTFTLFLNVIAIWSSCKVVCGKTMCSASGTINAIKSSVKHVPNQETITIGHKTHLCRFLQSESNECLSQTSTRLVDFFRLHGRSCTGTFFTQ
jgi:hypothetical protein